MDGMGGMGTPSDPGVAASRPAHAGWLTVAEFAVRHAFFEPRPVPGLRWRPAAASVQALQRAGLRLASTAEGFALMLPAESLTLLHARVHEAEAGYALFFTGHCSDAAFASATAGLATLGLLDTAHAEPPDATQWQTLRTDAALPLPALEQAERRVPPPLVLRLHLERDPGARPGNPAPDGQALQAWSRQALGRRWRLALASRALHWKYLLPAEWAGQQPRIVDLAGEVAFDTPVSEPLADGRAALAVRSRMPIALRQRAPQRFQLQALAPAADPVLVRRLPAAGAGQLQTDTIDGRRTLVAAIHVQR